jgi:multidrug resistance protein, MATE family
VFSKAFNTEVRNTAKLAIPMIIAQLGAILMGVTDNIIVGRLLGAQALGAAGIGNSNAFLFSSLALGGLSVLAPMVSKLVVEKNLKGVAQLFRTSIVLALIYSVFVLIICLFLYYNFGVLQQTEAIENLASNYFLIIVFSNVFLFLFTSLKQFTDGFSLPKISMTITIVGLVFNAIFNVILIKGLWFFPQLGLNGSAWATFITRLVMFLVMLIYIVRHKTFTFIFNQKIGIFFKHQIKSVLSKSIPSGFQFFFEIAAFTFALNMMGWIGELELAAHQIAINIASTTYMMATGIAYAGGIRVGEGWGNRSRKSIYLSGYAAYYLVFLFMSFWAIFILVLKQPLLQGYIDDPAVIAKAIPLLIIAAFFQLSDGIQVVGLGALRGLQDVKIPTTITFVAYWVLALPLGYFLGFKFNLGAQGIWWGLLIGLTVSAIALYVRFRNLVKPMNFKKRIG